MSVVIGVATREDLLALAEVNRSGYSLELPSRFVYKDWTDTNGMRNFFKARLAARFDHEATQIFKACDSSSGEALGLACWTLEPANSSELEQTPTAAVIQQMPPGFMNVELLKAAGPTIEALRSLMKNEEHYYLSAFAVHLDHQNKGIGSLLLQHCLKIADDADLPSWLISFPGSHNLYLRFGFEDVDHRDLDLNAWDQNRMRGFGVYRQYAMVRRLR
ncbi:acetyltransferase (GNAT) family protein [Sarocladium implicatum]|nr:acetyltransferase (GNAT) family protein [Sarocladium implicatum]